MTISEIATRWRNTLQQIGLLMAEVIPLRACSVEMPIRVNGYDVDFQGVVHNIVYVRWFEDLRYRLLDEYLPLAEQMNAGFAPMLTSTHVEYKRPVRMLDQPIGRLWVSEASRVRWTVNIEIVINETIAATGVQTGVFIDLKTLKPVSVPDVFRDAVARAANTAEVDPLHGAVHDE